MLFVDLIGRRVGSGHRSSATVQEGERARWHQSFEFLVAPAVHSELVVRQCRRDVPAQEQAWGLLRLPVAEVVARGSHQGWFALADERCARRSRVHAHVCDAQAGRIRSYR